MARGDEWREEEDDETKRLNLWLTESCEGTLKSPKSFRVDHVALALVTFTLCDNVDAGGNFTIK